MGLRDRLNAYALASFRSSLGYDTVKVNGVTYPLGPYQPQPSLGQTREDIQDTYTDYARYAYGANSAIRTLVDRRRQVFSQGRFRFQQMRGGVPGDYFGTPALDVLDGPGRTDSGQDLMSQALQDADLAGMAIIVRERGPRLVCLRPDWVTIVAGSQRDPGLGMVAPDAEVLGIAYYPGGRDRGGVDPVVYLPGEFALFRYAPDPTFRFRGVSWISSAVREVQADSAATLHKLMFFENGATPSTVVSIDKSVTLQQLKDFKAEFERDRAGALNAYKTLYLGGGADVKVIGTDLQQIDFKVTQGAGETRLAAAAGVPPIIAGFSEGLAAATYSNYGQARRAYSDITIWDLWGKMANALESVIPPPPGSRMWVDATGIPFLQDDALDEAEISSRKATTIRTLVDGGWVPESAVSTVAPEWSGVLRHSGNLSVQLQPGGLSPEAGQRVASLIDQVKAGLITEDEARADLGRGPMVWSEDIGPDESAMLLDQLKAGVLTNDEVRAMLGRAPIEWSEELSIEEVASLIDQVKAGLLTENEARALMRRPPMEWSDGPSLDEVNTLVAQVKEGLLTIDEARDGLGRPPVQWPEDLSEKVTQAGDLIKAGFDPAAVMSALGLPPIPHLGLPPVTVQKALDADPPQEAAQP